MSLKDKLLAVKRKVFKNHLLIHAQEMLDNEISEMELQEMGVSNRSFKWLFNPEDQIPTALDKDWSKKWYGSFSYNPIERVYSTIRDCTNKSKKEILLDIRNRIDKIDLNAYPSHLQRYQEIELAAKVLGIQNVDEYVYDYIKLEYNHDLQNGKLQAEQINQNIDNLRRIGEKENNMYQPSNIYEKIRFKIKNKQNKAEVEAIYEATKDDNDPILFYTLMQNASPSIFRVYNTLLTYGVNDKNVMKSILCDSEKYVHDGLLSYAPCAARIFNLDYDHLRMLPSVRIPYSTLDEEIVKLTEKYLNKEQSQDAGISK